MCISEDILTPEHPFRYCTLTYQQQNKTKMDVNTDSSDQTLLYIILGLVLGIPVEGDLRSLCYICVFGCCEAFCLSRRSNRNRNRSLSPGSGPGLNESPDSGFDMDLEGEVSAFARTDQVLKGASGPLHPRYPG